jgi:hypothetical protein
MAHRKLNVVVTTHGIVQESVASEYLHKGLAAIQVVLAQIVNLHMIYSSPSQSGAREEQLVVSVSLSPDNGQLAPRHTTIV